MWQHYIAMLLAIIYALFYDLYITILLSMCIYLCNICDCLSENQPSSHPKFYQVKGL